MQSTTIWIIDLLAKHPCNNYKNSWRIHVPLRKSLFVSPFKVGWRHFVDISSGTNKLVYALHLSFSLTFTLPQSSEVQWACSLAKTIRFFVTATVTKELLIVQLVYSPSDCQWGARETRLINFFDCKFLFLWQRVVTGDRECFEKSRMYFEEEPQMALKRHYFHFIAIV